MLFEGAVLVEFRKGASSVEVPLVREEEQRPTKDPPSICRPPFNDVDNLGRLLGGMRSHRPFAIVVAHSEGNDPDRANLWEAIQNAEQRIGENVAVVNTGTDHDLSVDVDSSIEQHAQPPQAHRTPFVAQQFGAHQRIGRMDTYVQRRQPFVDDPFDIAFGAPGQRREVAVQEGQTIVVILEVQAFSHSFGQLIDETERAVVIAGHDPIKDGRMHFDPDGLTRVLFDGDAQLETSADDIEFEGR